MQLWTERQIQKIKRLLKAYLQAFYESLGFQTVQEPYLEDDIPHIEMLKRFG